MSTVKPLEVGQRVRCLYGTGFVTAFDADKKLVTIKLDSGGIKTLNPAEVEKTVSSGAPVMVGTTKSVIVEQGKYTATAPSVVKTTTTVTSSGGKSTTTTTTTHMDS
jgi:hypothetical protein